MEAVVGSLDPSNINSVVLAVAVLWGLVFISKHWWPDKVSRMDKQQELDYQLELAKVQADKERDAQLSQQLEAINSSILALHASLNDFLINNISHLLEERQDHLSIHALKALEDTGVFKHSVDYEQR